MGANLTAISAAERGWNPPRQPHFCKKQVAHEAPGGQCANQDISQSSYV